MASIKFRGVWYFSQSLSAANLSCKARLQREKLATDHPTCWAFSVNLHHGQVFSASHFFQGEIRAKFEVFNRFCLSSITLAGSTTWRIFHYSTEMGSSKLCRVHVELLLFTVWNEVRHKHGTELDNSQRELSSEHIISYILQQKLLEDASTVSSGITSSRSHCTRAKQQFLLQSWD